MATSLAPKSGSVLPYSPGLQGPGRAALLALIAIALATLFCLLVLYAFLASGADRTPARPTSTPVGVAITRGA